MDIHDRFMDVNDWLRIGMVRGLIYIFLSIVGLLSSDLVVLMTWAHLTSDIQSHVERSKFYFVVI